MVNSIGIPKRYFRGIVRLCCEYIRVNKTYLTCHPKLFPLIIHIYILYVRISFDAGAHRTIVVLRDTITAQPWPDCSPMRATYASLCTTRTVLRPMFRPTGPRGTREHGRPPWPDAGPFFDHFPDACFFLKSTSILDHFWDDFAMFLASII